MRPKEMASTGCRAMPSTRRAPSRRHRPRWGVDFGVDNYVQEAAITPRAVSFQKGCYLGQEVVCRLEMRGHVQKQLVSP
jgi:folate-binding protein YgfZ